MRSQQQFCFTHPSGEDIYLFELRNTNGTTVSITNYGAIVTSFVIKKDDGTSNDIVLGFDSVEEYTGADYLQGYPWFGAAIGRCSNRIKNGAFEIDCKRFQVTPNKGNDQLHGGEIGFDKKVWQFVNQGSSPNAWLELKYKSPDGEEGFPGNLDVVVRFELTNENELSYEYTASTDKPTVVNLTHHDYFNLNNGTGSIDDHEIKIYSSTVLDQDENLVVNGNLIAVDNTPFDLRDFTRIGDGLKKIPEYDKSFVVAKNENSLVAEVRSKQSGLLLQVYTTEPIVHFYSGKWIPAVKGSHGNDYGPFSGFCLETHIHPNAINIPAFPSVILRPGETYRQKTIYKLSY